MFEELTFNKDKVEEKESCVIKDMNGKEEELDTDKEYTSSKQERIFELLGKELKTEEDIITDKELVKSTREISEKLGFRDDIFDNPKDRPKIFYRALMPTKEVHNSLEQDENIQRPFSFTMPGIKEDLPLSYGGTDPVLIRIIDTSGEWEDTAKYFYGERATNWNEAINLNPVVLRKIEKRSIKINDLYKQVGFIGFDGDEKVCQATFIVDKIQTKRVRMDKSLEIFLNDTGFWKKIEDMAKNFSYTNPTDGKYTMKLNKKSSEYFNQTMQLDEEKAESEEAKQTLRKAKIEISRLIKKTLDVEEDFSWRSEARRSFLKNFSEQTFQEYSKIRILKELGENPSEEQKRELLKKIAEKIERKIG